MKHNDGKAFEQTTPTATTAGITPRSVQEGEIKTIFGFLGAAPAAAAKVVIIQPLGHLIAPSTADCASGSAVWQKT